MITQERKKVIMEHAKLCFISDDTQFDGVNLYRPSICNDEEWEWLNSGYQNAKKVLKEDYYTLFNKWYIK